MLPETSIGLRPHPPHWEDGVDPPLAMTQIAAPRWLAADTFDPAVVEAVVVFVKEPGRMAYGGMDAVFDDTCGNLISLHQD